MIKCQFHSIFNNTEQKTFMKSFYNILDDNNKMVKDPSYKDVYERKINDFIREVVINNRENINGPRPIILFYMMSSIVKFEFIKFSPNYENNILGANLLTLNNYHFKIILISFKVGNNQKKRWVLEGSVLFWGLKILSLIL